MLRRAHKVLFKDNFSVVLKEPHPTHFGGNGDRMAAHQHTKTVQWQSQFDIQWIMATFT
jgi:hypothetical protein